MTKMACCPICQPDEPLVLTLAVKFKEFVCVKCGRWYEWLEPKAVEPSRDLETILNANRVIYHANADKLVRGSITGIPYTHG